MTISIEPETDLEAPVGHHSLRISYVSSTYIPSLSALSVVAMKTCQAMAQEGNDVELIAQRPDPSPLAPDQTVWSHYGISHTFPIRTFGSSRTMRGVDCDGRSLVHVWRSRPELVYLLNLRAAAMASMRGWPAVFEAHDLPSGKLGAWYFRRLLGGKGLRAVVAISDGMKRMLLEEYAPMLRDERVVIARDGVDMERFDESPPVRQAKSRLGLEPDRFVAGYTGHLYQGRGIELILELARRLPQIQFLMVGGHADSVQERRHEAARLGISNVRYEGFVANADLPLYQAACDVLLMPYQRRVSFRDGRGDTSAVMSPMKMFEYMASERLIISSDLPVIQEVLNDSNAVLCGPKDVDAWEIALRRAERDDQWRYALARKARSDARMYTWRDRVKSVFDYLSERGGGAATQG